MIDNMYAAGTSIEKQEAKQVVSDFLSLGGSTTDPGQRHAEVDLVLGGLT